MMNDNEIETIISNANINEVSHLIKIFLTNNEKEFVFPSLSQNNRRVVLWTALFDRIQDEASESIHAACLATIRILSRDKTDLEGLLCEKWIIVLVEKAGFNDYADDKIDSKSQNQEILIEALKSLCNICFNSETARNICAQTCIVEGFLSRSKAYKTLSNKDDIMLLDMKLMFILTALKQDIKHKMVEMNGLAYLIGCLNDILVEVTSSTASSNHCIQFNDKNHAILCEILKTQFNVILRPGIEESVKEDEKPVYLKLMTILKTLLCAQCSSEAKLMDLRSNIANLLTSIPSEYYAALTPSLNENEECTYKYNGKNMEALEALVQLLQNRLTVTTNTGHQYENLAPILTVMNKGCRGVRDHRKYLRQVVLPPLKDVHRPPEKGNTLRNQLCRLLTTPDVAVRDLVAEFLFVLCKENVSRLVKYTGFGNAAGHLAQKGLLGGSRAGYSSSEESDTEEYRAAQPHIDPVVGCTRPPAANPFEGMSEEQKEYEAMKLVNMFDRMMSEGVIQPAQIGPDGRPQPMEHVLQFRDTPHRPQS